MERILIVHLYLRTNAERRSGSAEREVAWSERSLSDRKTAPAVPILVNCKLST